MTNLTPRSNSSKSSMMTSVSSESISVNEKLKVFWKLGMLEYGKQQLL